MINLKYHVFGHDWALDLLSQAIVSENISQSLLITGIPQIGKCTLALTLAMTMNCQGDKKPCGSCISCGKMNRGSHPDILLLTKDQNESSDAIKIEDVRQLQHNLSLRPNESLYKIAILSDFERATNSAANALLKTLEEPPSHVLLILTAQATNLLLPTIVSRCQVINLHPVANTVIAEVLQKQWHISTDKAQLLSRLAGGRLGWAITAATQPDMLNQRQQYLQDLIALLANNHAVRLNYAQKLATQPLSLTEILNTWLSWWRDILLLKNNALHQVINIDSLEHAQYFAQVLATPQILKAIKQTFATLQYLKYNVNVRLNLEVLLLNLPYLTK